MVSLITLLHNSGWLSSFLPNTLKHHIYETRLQKTCIVSFFISLACWFCSFFFLIIRWDNLRAVCVVVGGFVCTGLSVLTQTVAPFLLAAHRLYWFAELKWNGRVGCHGLRCENCTFCCFFSLNLPTIHRWLSTRSDRNIILLLFCLLVLYSTGSTLKHNKYHRG